MGARNELLLPQTGEGGGVAVDEDDKIRVNLFPENQFESPQTSLGVFKYFGPQPPPPPQLTCVLSRV